MQTTSGIFHLILITFRKSICIFIFQKNNCFLLQKNQSLFFCFLSQIQIRLYCAPQIDVKEQESQLVKFNIQCKINVLIGIQQFHSSSL